MARLFDRVARLVVVIAGQTINITGQRIAFRVDRYAGLEANSAVIQVYNLPEAARNLFVRRVPTRETLIVAPRLTAFLYAGYVGQPLALLSRGVGLNIDAQNARRGPDWITEFQTYSTLEQDVNARLQRSYAATSAIVILDELVKAWGYPPTEMPKEIREFLTSTVLASYTANGSVKQSIRNLLARFELSMTVNEEGHPIVAVTGNAFDAGTAEEDLPRINQRRGMIGSPQITRQGISVRTLLDPRIAPLHSFLVESDTVTATLGVFSQRYTAIEVQHIGDSRGDDWFTEASGIYPAFARTGAGVPLQSPEPVR